ncbi:MAG: O-antigen translocase [Verrucomicrobia bacterium]|nr:O-antigen translocase [Verrucomicrobiota bacterium]
MSNPSKSSHAQILKSSAVIGGSSAINLVIGMVRTKAMALLLGVSGYGLFSIYWNISELARIVAGMGINNSGVRQIAESVDTGDSQRIGRTVTTLRRVALALGVLGALLLFIFRQPVARISFGDDSHAWAVGLLSLAVLMGSVSQGQMALLQGMRRIADLAQNNILGAFCGTLISVPIVYFYGEKGVVPALVLVALAGVASSWWFSRNVKVERVAMTTRDVTQEAAGMLKLGFVFMTSALLTTGVTYCVQLILRNKIGVESGIEAGKAAVGCYQAAWFVGGYFAGFILQAMGTDFYPRLTVASKDNAECNRLVNEQAEVSLLLAGPGLLATLTFAPLVILLQYSSKFEPAVEVLRWICLGMMLRVVTWPIGFIIVAKNAQKLFFWTEVFANAIQVGLVWLGVQYFGLKGAGIGFFGMYVIQFFTIYLIVRSLSGFRWTTENIRIGSMYGVLVAALFVSSYFLPKPVVLIAGSVATVLTGIFSLRKLCSMLPVERFPRRVRQLLGRLRLLPANSNA